MVGSLGYMVMKSGYDNESKVQAIKSPTLIIHGKKDELIHHNHSITIFGRYFDDLEKMTGKVELVLPDEMTHSLIDPFVHITDPICRFMDKVFKPEKYSSQRAASIPLRYFTS